MVFSILLIQKKFYFKKSNIDKNFVQIIIPHGAYEIESLNNEIEMNFFDTGCYSDEDYPFKIKLSFSTLGSNVELSPQVPIIGFVFNDGLGNLLGFNETILWQDYKLSPNPVDILSFDSIFIECKIAKRMTFRGRRSEILHGFNMTVSHGYKYVQNLRGGLQGYMMNTNDFISSINFKLETENNETFNGQSITFRLSIKED